MQHHFLIKGPVGALELKTDFPEMSFETLVILCHPHPLQEGTMDHKVVTMLKKTFSELGAGIIRFNYRGVGKSEGSFDNTLGETEDLVAVSEWATRSIPYKRLILAGFSFGSYIAAKGASELKPSLLVTVAPSVLHNPFGSLIELPCPWVVLMGTEDEVVPFDAVFSWFEKRKAAKPEASDFIRFDKTGHFFHGQLMTLYERLKAHVQPFFQ